MISMTTWIYIVKSILKSKLTKKEIREAILKECLLSDKKFLGAYQVDSDKVWNNIITKDQDCIKSLERLKIDNVDNVIGYYEETEYKKMRSTYPRKHHTKG